MTTAEDKANLFKLLVMNVLSDIVYDNVDDATRRHLQRLYDSELDEPSSDVIHDIADDVFGNLPHGGT